MMDNNNNNNMMEINTEETQKKREKQEKIENFKKKIKSFKDKLKEDKEDKKRAKEEKARVKAEEKEFKESQRKPADTGENFTFSSSTPDITITNETIKKPTKQKKVLTPQEERQRKRKRKKLIRNIMTIPEIIIVALVALFLKDKYIDYSKNVHQILNYTSDNYIYEIHRDNDIIKVSKNIQEACEEEPCNLKRISDYEVKFSKNQMTAIRVFLDVEFRFKSTTKTINMSDIKTELGRRSIYSMIHNNASFLSTDTYKKYNVVDYEQMSNYTTRGYKYTTNGDRGFLFVAMGERQTSGYALVVNQAYKKGDAVYFYIKEQKPSGDETYLSLVTHPMVQIELEEKPSTIYVYNIESGEEYTNLDAPTETHEPGKENDKGVAGIIGEMQTNLKNIFK